MNTKPNPWNNFNPPRLNPVTVYDVTPRKAQAAPPAPDNSLIHKHLPDPADRMLLARWDALPPNVYHRALFTDAEHRKILVLLSMRDRLNAQAEEERERDRLNGTTATQRPLRTNTTNIAHARKHAETMRVSGQWSAARADEYVKIHIDMANR
jgi:hypothetical protein